MTRARKTVLALLCCVLTPLPAALGQMKYPPRLSGGRQVATDTAEAFLKPFASPLNVRHEGEHWTDSFSHGELLRDGFDEKLRVDPADVRMLFQGVTDRAKRGKKYGDIPWRLGMLRRR